MKLIISKNQISEQPEQFLRRAGYGYITDYHTGHDSFVRRLAHDFYPRLHMYIDREDDKIIFNLHLDQKKASYQGSHMHNAEYDGEVVENEISRLKSLLKKSETPFSASKENNNAPFFSQDEDDNKKEEPKGFWRKLFS
jgi:hypothetical protein